MVNDKISTIEIASTLFDRDVMTYSRISCGVSFYIIGNCIYATYYIERHYVPKCTHCGDEVEASQPRGGKVSAKQTRYSTIF